MALNEELRIKSNRRKEEKELLILELPTNQSIIFMAKKLKCTVQEEINNTTRNTNFLLIYFIKNHSSI